MNLDASTLIWNFSSLLLKADQYIKKSNIMSLMAGPLCSPVLGATPCGSSSLNGFENHGSPADMNHASRNRTLRGVRDLELGGEEISSENSADGSMGRVGSALNGRQRVPPLRVTVEDNSDELISLKNPKPKNGSILKSEKVDSLKVKKWRPPKLQIPQCTDSAMPSVRIGDTSKEKLQAIEIEGSRYSVACKKGRRDVMEDSYRAMLDVSGDSKQAFFGVFDGHGGREAADFAAENLGQNILNAMAIVGRGDSGVEQAVKAGYLATDEAFLKQNVRSGTCCVTALITDGNLVVGNVGDCRAVLSRDGSAEALTRDHRPGRQDERQRIENLGGYVDCHHGIWRVQGLLAVTRAIGDLHTKEWISGEPDTKRLQITSDCEFLILASDGLWDKVNIQEAVDVARTFCVDGQRAVGLGQAAGVAACRKLVELAVSRGTRDDVTVMIVDLVHFCLVDDVLGGNGCYCLPHRSGSAKSVHWFNGF